jgi:ribose 5-phosphate isomerase B
MKIAIGSDHAGFAYKEALKESLSKMGHDVMDFGAHSSVSSDYADFAHPVSESVESKQYSFGILVCGSANGVAITANKHAGIRAAICWNTELAQLARAHNDANIVCLPARFISDAEARAIVEKFLSTSFEGGRHATRISKINC